MDTDRIPFINEMYPTSDMSHDKDRWTAFTLLPDDDQAILKMRFWVGMGVAEIAAKLDVDEDFVYRRSERAYLTIGKSLGDSDPNPVPDNPAFAGCFTSDTGMPAMPAGVGPFVRRECAAQDPVVGCQGTTRNHKYALCGRCAARYGTTPASWVAGGNGWLVVEAKTKLAEYRRERKAAKAEIHR